MAPIPNTRRDGGPAPVRTPPRRAAAAACLRLGALCAFFGVGGAALAQQQQRPDAPPPRSTETSPEWQRQQPTQERARGLMRQEGVLPSQQERREELRTLNEIYREVMPEGRGAVPAPGLAPDPGPRGER
ncbi:hypothetical protein GCM10009416_00400 [Craurococcus roseus]|uniref:DUF4148 domain-containing protein n=1 Tax=Craurococcus roseus TaxID=77585 RepID=A0ABP3PK82_9PROT